MPNIDADEDLYVDDNVELYVAVDVGIHVYTDGDVQVVATLSPPLYLKTCFACKGKRRIKNC